jgi:endonuclease YncB( thermonuclease family)
MPCARVVRVNDGDTLKVLVLAPGNELLRVRLSWIDAPESKQTFGQLGAAYGRIRRYGQEKDCLIFQFCFDQHSRRSRACLYRI